MPREANAKELDVYSMIDRMLRGGITGEYLVDGTVGVSKLHVDEVSSITLRLGRIEAADIFLGWPAGPYIRLADQSFKATDKSPSLIVATPRGPIFSAVTTEEYGIVGLGYYNQWTDRYPIQVDDDGVVTIDGNAIVVGDFATTILRGDYIWVGTEMDPHSVSDPSAEAITGILLDPSGWFLYIDGYVGVSAYTFEGSIHAGAERDVVLDRNGLNFSLPDSEDFPSAAVRYYHGEVGTDTNFFEWGAEKYDHAGSGNPAFTGFSRMYGEIPRDGELIMVDNEMSATFVSTESGQEFEHKANFRLSVTPRLSAAFISADVIQVQTETPGQRTSMTVAGQFTAGEIRGPSIPTTFFLSGPDEVPVMQNGELAIGYYGGEPKLYVKDYNGVVWRFVPDNLVGA